MTFTLYKAKIKNLAFQGLENILKDVKTDLPKLPIEKTIFQVTLPIQSKLNDAVISNDYDIKI